MNQQEQNKKPIAYNFAQQQIIEQFNKKIQSIQDDMIKHDQNIKDEIYALENFMSMNLLLDLDVFQNERNKQLKIQSKELDYKKIIQEEIKQYLEFDCQVQFTRYMEQYNQQQQNKNKNEMQINNYEQEINLLKENINCNKNKMEDLEKKIEQTYYLHYKYQDLEKEINKLQPLETKLEQKIQMLFSEINPESKEKIKHITQNQYELSERFQKLERKYDEKNQQTNKLILEQQQRIDVLQQKLQYSYDQLSIESTKNFQSDIIGEFKQLEKQNEEKFKQLEQLLNEQVQKQLNYNYLQTQACNIAEQKVNEINIKLQQLEKDIILLTKQQKVNTDNLPQMVGQKSQNGISQNSQNQFQKFHATMQVGSMEQPKFQIEKSPNKFQSDQNQNKFQFEQNQNNLQRYNFTFNPFQQFPQQQQNPIQQKQFPYQTGQQTIQPGQFDQRKQSMMVFQRSTNDNIKYQSQLKIPSFQSSEANLSIIQNDFNRFLKIKQIINKIYDETTRKRSASGNYQCFIREVEDFQQFLKHYGIKTLKEKQTLKEICNAFRQARGDGNCFYTAFGFQVIQILISEFSNQDYKLLIDKLGGKFKCQIQLQNEKFSGDEFHNSVYYEFLYRLQEFRKIQNIEERINSFTQHFQAYDAIPGQPIDGCLYGLSTIFFRNLAYYVVENSEEKDMIDDQQALLKWEAECNSNEIVIKLLADYLNINIKLLFFDKGEFQKREYNQNSRSSILLLIQPGHYNIGLKIP
ncbi:unnamed protein product [Paramecium octaurelia]|uniref:OTU domain-containing protein n=1 Tax=Paramecium octaurelia TaxID=43137 RepID=A0A8S1WCL9_PAROT|nr:unnamed protein product [Paramecium octaurelia]